MEVCPPELTLPPSNGIKQTYSGIHVDNTRPSLLGSLQHARIAGLALPHDAVVLGQGDASDGSGGLAPEERLGVQERDVGAPRRAVGATGRRLDASGRPVDARERHLGAEAAVLAPPGGRPLDARPGDLAQDGGDRRVAGAGGGRRPRAGPRQWHSESDLASSEEATARPGARCTPPPAAGSDSDSESERRQAWRSESHLSVAAARGTLSQRHRSQPCLLAARPDYSGVCSRVAAYIQRRRQQDRAARARRRRHSRSPEPPAGDAADAGDGGDGGAPGGDCRTLAARLALERAERKERERQLEQLQTEYEQLVTKYAEAETYIDRMRFRQPISGPSSEALRPAASRDSWDVREESEKMISPNETHTSQSSMFSRLSGVKSAILRRHSDEEPSFRRFVQSKKELFPDDVRLKDSGFSDRGSVDLNSSVKNPIDGRHLYDMSASPGPAAAGADFSIGGDSSPLSMPSVSNQWQAGPPSAPPALSRDRRPSAQSCRSEEADRRPGQEAGGAARHSGPTRWSGGETERGSDRAETPDRSSVGRHGSRDPSPDHPRESHDLSPGLREAYGVSTGDLRESHSLSPEGRQELGDSVAVFGPGSRSLSLEDEGSSHHLTSVAPSESSRDPSPEERRESRDMASASREDKPDPEDRQRAQETDCLPKPAARGSEELHRPRSRDRSPAEPFRSRDPVPVNRPESRGSSPTGSSWSRAPVSDKPAKSRDPSAASRPRIRAPVADDQARSRDPSLVSRSQSRDDRCRRRSSSEPGCGRCGRSPPAAEAKEAQEPPASRERLQGVLSVLASQVEMIQAMVGQRGRPGRRCRSLSRRISRNRVSVTPGDVAEHKEIVGVQIGRQSTSSRSPDLKRCRSEVSGRECRPSRQGDCCSGRVDWTGGEPGGNSVLDGPDSERGEVAIRGDTPASPTCWSPDHGSAEAPPNQADPVHRSCDVTGAGRRRDGTTRLSSPSSRHRRAESAAGTASAHLSGRGRSPGRDGGDQTPSGGRRRRVAVPPLPLSELDSEPGDGVGSLSSLVSPRTVSPTKKVEQWQARLAEVTPEPVEPPEEDRRQPGRPVPELRRLAGAVRGLQRQMSGFCRLVDELRTPGSPGTPSSSEASEPRRRRRYLRERRGLQLPLLPDKPAPPEPGPGRRWDISRPPARRAASCERAVQTDAAAGVVQEATPPAHARSAGTLSDGERTTPAGRAAQPFRDVGASAQWDRANLLAREVNLRSRCILEGVIRTTAC